jgi:DNA-binding MarR family transcriptional regulator
MGRTTREPFRVPKTVSVVNGLSAAISIDPLVLANELRPVLLKLSRQLRREEHLDGLTGGQVSLLGQIKLHPEIGMRELAALIGVSVPAASVHVRRLERAGFVEKAIGTDRRRIGLTVTPAGARVLRSVMSRRTAWLVSRLQRLEPESLESIGAAVHALAQLVDATE